MKIGNPRVLLSVLVLTVLTVATFSNTPASLNAGKWTGEIDGIGPGFAVEVIYEGAFPFRGPFIVTVTNSGNAPWGDFHFEIFDPVGGQDISNINFLDAGMGGVDPVSSQSGLVWVIDNEAVGATIDLFYCSDPVMPGETAFFEIFLDNPDELPFFGIMFYPTPVPPSAVCCDPDGGCTITCEYDCVPPSVWYPDWDSCDPNPCEPVPVEEPSWGTLKRLYR